MPLHKRESVRDELIDSVYADQALKAPLPSTHCPSAEMQPYDVMQAITDELMLDGNARQNLATFCQTWEEPQVHQLMDLCIDKNLIDKDEYPQTAELERRCVRMLAGLWNAPEQAEPVGCSAIGSSEACMLGGMAAKWRWRAKRQAAGKPTDSPNMVCGPVQVVWHKFARYWDVEIREIPMSPGRYQMDVEQMLERVDENTIMVVPTFGVTYTGSYEPVLELSQALDTLQQDTGLDIDIHVDGASGAFLAPFCAPDVEWDFRVPRGEVDQHLGSQVRPGAPRGGVGAVAGRGGAARATSSSTSRTWAGTCRCSRSTSRGRPARSWRSTTTSCVSAGTVTATSTTLATARASSWPRRWSSSVRSSCCATPIP